MIYICPTCGKEYETEEEISKHYLKCWKNNNTSHQSKPAPRSEDITTREMGDDVVKFFALLEGELNNERNNGKNSLDNY